MFEVLFYPFLAGTLAAFISSIIGVIIVLKRISSIVGAISHASFSGIGFAYYLGIYPLYGAFAVSPFLGFLIGFISNKYKQSGDSLMSLIWALGMSIGILFVYLSQGYNYGLMNYIFGNLLFVNFIDLIIMSILFVVICIFFYLFFWPLVSISFDEEFAKVNNLPVKIIYYLFLIIVSFSIVSLIKVIGLILVIAFLTIPTLTSLNFSKRIYNLFFYNFLFTEISIIAGLYFSYIMDLPASPIIVFILSIFYLISLFFKNKIN